MATKQEIINRKREELEDAINTVSHEEFLGAFESVVKLVKKVQSQLLSDAQSLTDLIKKAEGKLGDTNKSDLDKIKGEVDKALNKALDKQSNSLNFIRDKVRKIQDGIDGLDGKDGVAGVDGSPDTPEEIRNKLEKLKGKERLDWKSIRGLEDELKELRDRPTGKFGGGGVTDIGVQAALGRSVKTETPSGLIDSANKAYTITSVVNAVLAFAINGEVIHSGEYSISGKTITFTTALDASLSGTSFEITYL